MTRNDVRSAVNEAVVGALGVEADDVKPGATLLGDLGAESIDLLDILFRLERKVGVKIQASDLSAYVQGGIPDDEFGDANEMITPRGLDQLKKVMPQIDTQQLAGKLQASQVMSHFTVDNLTEMVAQRANVS